MPSNDELKEGLRIVLAHYPHLSGRMVVDENTQKPCFVLNDAGVRLVETSVSASLAEKLPLEATTELTDLHPSVDGEHHLIETCFLNLVLVIYLFMAFLCIVCYVTL